MKFCISFNICKIVFITGKSIVNISIEIKQQLRSNGNVENFLSWLLKDKIPRYLGILPSEEIITV